MARSENIEVLEEATSRFQRRDLDGYLKLYDNAVIHHGFSSRIRPGVAGLRDHYTGFLKAFPDMRIDIQDIIADGDKLAHRILFSGTHKGEFLGQPPTGKMVRADGIHIHAFKNRKAVEVWQVFDNLTFLLEIGAVSRMRSKG
jgi:predicted ester cyclase